MYLCQRSIVMNEVMIIERINIFAERNRYLSRLSALNSFVSMDELCGQDHAIICANSKYARQMVLVQCMEVGVANVEMLSINRKGGEGCPGLSSEAPRLRNRLSKYPSVVGSRGEDSVASNL